MLPYLEAFAPIIQHLGTIPLGITLTKLEIVGLATVFHASSALGMGVVGDIFGEEIRQLRGATRLSDSYGSSPS